MAKGSPARLELHRLRYLQAGGKMALLSYGDLAPDDFEMISMAVRAEALANGGQQEPYEVLASVLPEFGVMCPHPEHRRGRWRQFWYTCGVCGIQVLREPRPVVAPQGRARGTS